MKMNLKAKDFADKENLKKSLDTLLKKPLMALLSGKVEKLPFCYEVDYFGPDEGFISIGVAKEVDKMFKTKRCKGQGLEGKIDKKKVAYGVIKLNPEGGVEFCVLGGMMKQMQAKKVIKSINILKKKIGDKFIISKGENIDGETIDENDTTTVADVMDAGAAVTNEIKNLIVTIGNAMKDTISTTVVPNVKRKVVSDNDMKLSIDLMAEIEKLKKLYESAEENVKKSVSKHYEKIMTYIPQLDKITTAIEKLLGTSDGNDDNSDDDAAQKNKEMEDFLKYMTKKGGELKAELSKAGEAVIAEGQELLDMLK
ncbi:MAG: hypothetical protein MK207_00840 [Saprospiraceae bacterium]|nr:hypothetical protein [Saprospiraceae bacterium]